MSKSRVRFERLRTVLAAAEWMRIAYMQFLSSEGLPLMGIKDFGEWKFYAITRFRSIFALTVMSSLKTKSPIPEWARRKFETAWNLNEQSDPLAKGPECLSGNGL